MSKKGAGDIALNVITSHHAKSALSLKNAIPDLIWFNLGDFWATVTPFYAKVGLRKANVMVKNPIAA
jgi:hypothetical protein